MKCIEFSLDGYGLYDGYYNYLKSHNWKVSFMGGNGAVEQCEDCGCLMQHASG